MDPSPQPSHNARRTAYTRHLRVVSVACTRPFPCAQVQRYINTFTTGLEVELLSLSGASVEVTFVVRQTTVDSMTLQIPLLLEAAHKFACELYHPLNGTALLQQQGLSTFIEAPGLRQAQTAAT